MDGGRYVSDPTYVPSFRFSLKMLLLAFLLLAPVLWLYATLAKAKAKHEAEVAERTKAIWVVLLDAAKAAEQIRTTKGRAPNNRREIETLLGYPLSVDIGVKQPGEIYYEKASPTSYRLVFPVEWVEGFSGDFLMFDSASPKAGWVEVCN